MNVTIILHNVMMRICLIAICLAKYFELIVFYLNDRLTVLPVSADQPELRWVLVVACFLRDVAFANYVDSPD